MAGEGVELEPDAAESLESSVPTVSCEKCLATPETKPWLCHETVPGPVGSRRRPSGPPKGAPSGLRQDNTFPKTTHMAESNVFR